MVNWRARFNKDRQGAALIGVIGCVVLGMGLTYDVGSLAQMGAGFMPVVFGALMVLVAVVTWISSLLKKPSSEEAGSAVSRLKPEWRGWLCIVAGVAVFIALGNFGGLVPAAFAAVFVAAMGDRENTLASAGALAAVVDLFCVAVFHYGLHLQLPLFQWHGA
jgi:hypothetical protein